MKKYISYLISPSLSTKDQIFLIKRLSFLLGAGITVLDSLQMVKEQTKKKSYKIILEKIILDVSNGQNLAKSLSKFPKMFSKFSVSIIEFGELNGVLSENLNYLANELNKKNTLQKKVLSALVYPIVVAVSTFAIIMFLMIYLFPKITPVFQSLHIELPLSTRIVIFFSNFISQNFLYIFLGIIFFVFSTMYLLKNNFKFKYFIHDLTLKMPILGEIVKDFNLANSTRTLGLLLKSGVAVSEALPITEKTSNNLIYKNEFRKLSDYASRGEKISIYLNSKPELFPEVLSQIISVGEKSGNLSNSLIYLSELYETQVDDYTRNLGNLIEPMLMIVIGIMVGFIAISIITPIYSITTNLHG